MTIPSLIWKHRGDVVIKLNKSEGECMAIILERCWAMAGRTWDQTCLLLSCCNYGRGRFQLHPFESAQKPRIPRSGGKIRPTQGEPLPAAGRSKPFGSELFDRLKALSSIEGLGRRQAPAFRGEESQGLTCAVI